MCVMCSGVFQAYENYSFEELRFAAPTVPRPSENMLVRANTDGTLMANWTPGCVGYYNIHVVIDGFDAGECRCLREKRGCGVSDQVRLLRVCFTFSHLWQAEYLTAVWLLVVLIWV